MGQNRGAHARLTTHHSCTAHNHRKDISACCLKALPTGSELKPDLRHNRTRNRLLLRCVLRWDHKFLHPRVQHGSSVETNIAVATVNLIVCFRVHYGVLSQSPAG